MTDIITEVSAIIDSPPGQVYGVLADYREGHPSILPSYFTKLLVLEGGKGAGTIFETHLNFMGIRKIYHVEVTEVEPGRILLEADEKLGVFVCFTVDPYEGGAQSRLTIEIRNKLSPGIKGFIEKLLNQYINRRICSEEILLLKTYLQTK